MPNSPEEKLLEQLRAILLTEDRADRATLEQQIEEVQQLLYDYEKLGDHLRPHVKDGVEEGITNIRENFNQLFGNELTASLKAQIEDSQETVIEALYPIIGKLIRKFLREEMNKLIERVDNQVSSTFSVQNIKRKIVGIFTGVNENELALKEINAPIVQEVFVVQKESGLLLGSFSRNDLVDQDMIAGMMTAIKSFAEDAFQRDKQDDLETIQYESFNIFLQTFYSTYMAVVVSGYTDSGFKSRLRELCSDFASTNLNRPVREVNDEITSELSEALKEHFND